jgi:hypothetical protein
LAEHQVSRPQLLDARDLPLGLIGREKYRRLSAAAARQVGNGRKRGLRGTEAGDQLAVGDRPDPGRTDQPQAVREVFDPMRGSVPFDRRRMFSRCFQTTSNAKPSSIGKRAELANTIAVTGALTAATIPATDEIRSVTSKNSQTAA